MKLSTRLSLFFLATTALLLVGFSTALFAMAWTYLHGQADERLEAALNTLVAAAEVDEGGVEWEPQGRTLAFGRGTAEGQLIWALVDDAGRRVDGSVPESDPHFPMFLSPHDSARPGSFLDRQRRPWRVMFRRLGSTTLSPPQGDPPAPVPEAGGSRKYEGLTVGAAVSLAGVRETLGRLGGLVFVLSSATWLLALFVGGRVSRRALSPVAEMAGAARDIGGDEPGRRLPEPRSGDELEDLGRAFNGLLDRLYESHERQRRFTGDASHQLRTPLTAIQGQVDLALRQARTVEEYQRALAVVQGKTRHLRRIVDALLFLARADAESQRPRLEPVELSGWLRDHLAAWPGPRRGDIRLEIATAGPVFARAHATLLGELLDNLLDNACKYSEPGTPIVVRAGLEGGAARVDIEDHGIGIEGAEVPLVTGPFFRAATARLRDPKGLGLGLSVAARIAATFAGRLVVESRPGRGSTFSVLLPSAPSPGPAADEPGGAAAPGPDRLDPAPFRARS